MKLQLLGTGAISAKAMPSSYLINNRLLIDCGNGIVKHILNTDNDLYSIDTVLISHIHGDHFLDLPFLILLRSFKPIDNTLTIYGPKGLKKIIKKLVSLIYEDIIDEWDDIEEKAKVKYKTIKADSNYHRYNGFKVKVLEMNHGNTEPSFGFIINNIFGFSGDSAICESIYTILDTCEYSILDISFLKGGKSHMGLDNLKELSNKYKNTIIIPTHMNDDVREEIKKLNIENIKLHNDLDVING